MSASKVRATTRRARGPWVTGFADTGGGGADPACATPPPRTGTAHRPPPAASARNVMDTTAIAVERRMTVHPRTWRHGIRRAGGHQAPFRLPMAGFCSQIGGLGLTRSPFDFE